MNMLIDYLSKVRSLLFVDVAFTAIVIAIIVVTSIILYKIIITIVLDIIKPWIIDVYTKRYIHKTNIMLNKYIKAFYDSKHAFKTLKRDDEAKLMTLILYQLQYTSDGYFEDTMLLPNGAFDLRRNKFTPSSSAMLLILSALELYIIDQYNIVPDEDDKKEVTQDGENQLSGETETITEGNRI